jgi:hypothetical protein
MESNNGVRLSLHSVGSLFSESWKLYKERWSVLVEIVLLPVLVIVLGYIFIGFGLGPAFLALGGMVVFAGYIIFMFSMAPLIYSIQHATGMDESYRATVKLFWPLVWVSILSALAVIGGFVMLLIPGIWLAVAFSVGIYVFVVEQRRGIDALRASKDYIKGYWWAVLGRTILLGILVVVATAIIEAPFGWIGGKVAGSIASLFISLFFVPFSTIYHYKIFSNLRDLKPDLAAKQTREGTGFIKASAIVGLVAPVLILLAGVAFLGGAVVYLLSHPDRYAPPPAMLYNTQGPAQ